MPTPKYAPPSVITNPGSLWTAPGALPDERRVIMSLSDTVKQTPLLRRQVDMWLVTLATQDTQEHRLLWSTAQILN